MLNGTKHCQQWGDLVQILCCFHLRNLPDWNFMAHGSLKRNQQSSGGVASAAAAAAKSLQSCPTLCDPIDGSPSGSPVPGILQARTLEWVAFPSPVASSSTYLLLVRSPFSNTPPWLRNPSRCAQGIQKKLFLRACST